MNTHIARDWDVSAYEEPRMTLRQLDREDEYDRLVAGYMREGYTEDEAHEQARDDMAALRYGPEEAVYY
jgi:AICAR transformylase/IMP cyclohydrolase PurH